ncbi:hypothetical protein B0H65DRAFT_73738 [Neurospora tetraspora]|uniref:Uncharacterized protein n=1 Tax=Neurospora tetraspora TaxID=94610 RepID=A0AAE0JRQ0_9PEZI|nr:hypothetical protein B0H65DRAFT_73738 [Neurospora tetraspora]
MTFRHVGLLITILYGLSYLWRYESCHRISWQEEMCLCSHGDGVSKRRSSLDGLHLRHPFLLDTVVSAFTNENPYVFYLATVSKSLMALNSQKGVQSGKTDAVKLMEKWITKSTSSALFSEGAVASEISLDFRAPPDGRE